MRSFFDPKRWTTCAATPRWWCWCLHLRRLSRSTYRSPFTLERKSNPRPLRPTSRREPAAPRQQPTRLPVHRRLHLPHPLPAVHRPLALTVRVAARLTAGAPVLSPPLAEVKLQSQAGGDEHTHRKAARGGFPRHSRHPHAAAQRAQRGNRSDGGVSSSRRSGRGCLDWEALTVGGSREQRQSRTRKKSPRWRIRQT